MSVDLIELYNQFENDIPKEHILLTKLEEKEIKQILKENIIKYIKTKAKITNKNNKIVLVYHKIGKDGFYNLLLVKENNRHIHSYTSFRCLTRKCIKEQYSISKIDVTNAYGIRKDRGED